MKADKINSFDPSSPAAHDGIFGLPFNEEESDLILIPVPWDVTVSYSAGTAAAPKAILNASKQVDLYEPIYPNAWQHGIFMRKANKWIERQSEELRPMAERYIKAFTEGRADRKSKMEILERVNNAGQELRERLQVETLELLREGKVVGLLGGDHSTPLGFIEALGELYPSFAVLQIDAHMDLRKAYEGFTYSHASVMFNALQLPAVKQLTQVGIRDYSDEELQHIEIFHAGGKKVTTHYDRDLKHRLFEGATWRTLCDEIINALPDDVYISFDIDGLDPKLCPHTGTPVPGGLEFDQAVYLLERLVDRGKNIIGFDLNEVAPGSDEWDANVGARMLYKLCNLALKSRFNKPLQEPKHEDDDALRHHRIDYAITDKENAD